jgi:hypothetical protein
MASSITVRALEGSNSDYAYSSDGASITITEYLGSDKNISITNTIDDLPVTVIGNSAFDDKSLSSVIIPSGITSIGTFAFANNEYMTSITIPDTVATIGEYAFYNCKALKSITIPDGVTNIGDLTFYKCYTLASITISGSVTNIGRAAFASCYDLKSIEIPDSITNIGDSVFSSCYDLMSITIPGGVTNIGDKAFYRCSDLTNVTIPDSVISIGDEAFRACTSLQKVVLGNSIAHIGASAFLSCSKLTDFSMLPDSLTSIDLLGLAIEKLTEITVDDANPAFCSLDGVLFNKNQTTLVQFPLNKSGSYLIPNSVTTIGADAFYCSTLESISIPDSVTAIGDDAFLSCDLTNITIPDSVTTIGMKAFAFSNLQSITIPDSVTTLGREAFYYCSNLTSATIGDGVTTIKYRTFGNCENNLTSVTIGNGVTNIESYAFKANYHLTEIYFTGNAPILDGSQQASTEATIYYLPGTSGWGESYGGYHAALWNPLIVVTDEDFGVQTTGFNFNISESASGLVVVKGCTNLAAGIWEPIQTNSMGGGIVNFSDSKWTDNPSFFYKLTMP